MCELNYLNTGRDDYNRKLFLLNGTIGSYSNSDGWGFGDITGMWKTSLPLYQDFTAGATIRKLITKKQPFIGHVRKASPLVPVCDANSHPFMLESIIFQHNGKLTPNVEKDFNIEYEREVWDEKLKKMEKKKFKRSDSLVFFEEFMKNFTDHSKFVETLQQTMEKFHGKFAMMFIVDNTTYIVKGRTANLYISYLKESTASDAKTLGYVVNTSFSTLDMATTLLTNLEALEGRNAPYFTLPEALKDETIYRADKTDIVKIGEIKENSAPIVSSYVPRGGEWAAGDANFTKTVTTGGTHNNYTGEDKLLEDLYNFLDEYCLSYRDFSEMINVGYGMAVTDIELPILEHFMKHVVPLLQSRVEKKLRKKLRNMKQGIPVSRSVYFEEDKPFPWMLWTPHQQKGLLK